jgi:lysophospholipase L1-like esterase
MRYITLFLLIAMLSDAPKATAQPLLPYPFLKYEENTIQNTAVLQDFVTKMRARSNGEQNTINIVHIGDSHIQADWFGERIRELLQTKFGNAGRGLIVPFRVAGSNEPNNFFTSANGIWQSRRVVVPGSLPIGIGGLTLQTTNPQAAINIKLNSHSLTQNIYQEVRVFCDKQNGFDWQIKNSQGTVLQTITNDDATQNADYVSFILPKMEDSKFTIQCKANATGTQATVFGISIASFDPGLRYHSIGINGAKYENYNAASRFAKQVFHLKPDLIVIGLGTNEAQTAVQKETLKAQITTLVTSLKNETYAPILLYTPADSYLHGSANPHLPTVSEAIKEVILEQNLALWDLYKISGAKGSALQWRTFRLLNKDGIHYSKKGYYTQAELLHDAMLKLLN